MRVYDNVKDDKPAYQLEHQLQFNHGGYIDPTSAVFITSNIIPGKLNFQHDKYATTYYTLLQQHNNTVTVFFIATATTGFTVKLSADNTPLLKFSSVIIIASSITTGLLLLFVIMSVIITILIVLLIILRKKQTKGTRTLQLKLILITAFVTTYCNCRCC